jgi:hypothetical protein
MWGTVTPDQRPTDLGVNDGGFDFRGTDDAREFIWSQTQWIEVTEVRYGTHAGRPNPLDVVNGALYVEFDRGGAIYQNQNNVWKYLAGTMFGTLSPDQRPTDLGVNDAGFDFRTSVAPAREFIWSQTAWVEVTPIGGFLNLTHPNVVTKVSATSGTIVEGGITDESAANSNRLHITAAGNVGLNISVPGSLFHVAGNGALDTPQGTITLSRYWASPTDTRASAIFHYYNSANGQDCLCFAVAAPSNPGQFSNVKMLLTASGGVAVPNLPSANPGAGTKQLWYDPADGNRVKYQP